MDSTQSVNALNLSLRDLVDRLHGVAGDLTELERVFVDGLLQKVGFTRGVLFHGSSQSVAGLLPVCGRTFDGDECAELTASPDVSSDLAASTRIVKQVVESGDPAIQLFTSPSEPQLVVLCQSCRLSDLERAVLYLDVPVDRFSPEAASADLAAELEQTLKLAWPVLRAAYLEQELSRLRDVEASLSPGLDDDDLDFEAGEETEEQAWALSEDDLPVFHGIIGRSQGLKKIFEVVGKIKDTDFNVCILGESGTGKELLAKAIHDAGRRRDAQFVSENCGAISETLLESELFGHVKGAFTGAEENRQGLFELATGGTLFLDEIGDMSEGMQRKLLRVLQERVIRPIGSKETISVDVRVICASNRDLRMLVEKGGFRADLYYRLNVIMLDIPPVRERMEDVPYLVKGLLVKLQKEGFRRRLSQSAIRALMSYNWPGNVRELENVLRRLAIMGSRRLVTRKEILPLLSGGPARSYIGEGVGENENDNQIVLRIPQRQTFNEIIAECEKAVLLNALRENRWNKSRVTKVLQIPRQSLYNKIAKYKLRKKRVVENA
jgi:transcriptional regulator with GAF, ATPase, and Fis domain